MRFYEAMKLLEEGKKVRKIEWETGEYIYKNSDDLLADETKTENPVFSIEGEWEEYIEPEQFREDTKMIEELNIMLFSKYHYQYSELEKGIVDNLTDVQNKVNELVRVINKRVLDKEGQ